MAIQAIFWRFDKNMILPLRFLWDHSYLTSHKFWAFLTHTQTLAFTPLPLVLVSQNHKCFPPICVTSFIIVPDKCQENNGRNFVQVGQSPSSGSMDDMDGAAVVDNNQVCNFPEFRASIIQWCSQSLDCLS